ncbi:MAG: hypothetical protein ACJ71G_11790 [Nitrososphaeraceae archaeon]
MRTGRNWGLDLPVNNAPDVLEDGTVGKCGDAFCPYALLIHTLFIHEEK